MTIEKALASYLRKSAALQTTLADELDPAVPAPAPSNKAALFIPLYSRDMTLWDQVIVAGERVPTTVIVNPASGPGTSVEAFYADVVKKLVPSKVRMLGYVQTQYGDLAKRSVAQVKADIETWYRLYPGIDGIFFDQQAKDAAHVALYADYFAAVKKHNGYVASNAGLGCDQGYYSAGKPDTLVLWENTAAAGTPTLSQWAKDAPDLSCTALVHDCNETTMLTLVPKVIATGYGQVFFTPSSGWDSLGSFDKLVAALA